METVDTDYIDVPANVLMAVGNFSRGNEQYTFALGYHKPLRPMLIVCPRNPPMSHGR